MEKFLVSREWLEKVDATLDAPKKWEEPPKTSPFYLIRPARLETAWSQNAAGVWVATASFVVNDVADASFVFPVYAPTATSNPGGTAQTTRFFVVWRGRWELVASAGGGGGSGTLMSKTLVTGVTASVTNNYCVISTTGTTIYYYGETQQ